MLIKVSSRQMREFCAAIEALMRVSIQAMFTPSSATSDYLQRKVYVNAHKCTFPHPKLLRSLVATHVLGQFSGYTYKTCGH